MAPEKYANLMFAFHFHLESRIEFCHMDLGQ